MDTMADSSMYVIFLPDLLQYCPGPTGSRSLSLQISFNYHEMNSTERLKGTRSSIGGLRSLARQQEKSTTAELGLLLRRLSMCSCQCLNKAPISIIDKALIKPLLHLASQMPHHRGQIPSRTELPHHTARCELATWPWGQHMAKVQPINELYSDYHKCGI